MDSRVKHNIQEKIDNKEALIWAIGRLEHLNVTNTVQAKEFEDEVFNDFAVRRIIGRSDDRVLSSVFRVLRPERFAIAITEISRKWTEWDDVVACWAAPVIARLQPEKFPSIAEKYFSNDRAFDDLNKAYGTIRALMYAEPTSARECMGRIAGLFVEIREQSIFEMYADDVSDSAIFLKIPDVLGVIECVLTRLTDEDKLKSYLETIYEAIAGDFEYYDLAIRRLDGEATLRFSDMPHLFNDPEISASLDRILSSESQDAVSDLMALLGKLSISPDASEFDPLPFAKHFSESYGFPQARLRPYLAFIAGLIASDNSSTSIDVTSLSLDEILKILSLDLAFLPGYNALVDTLRTVDRNIVVEAMIESHHAPEDTYGETRILTTMGDLGYEEFIPHIINSAGEESGDLTCEEAASALSKIGEPAAKEIAAKWSELDSSQKIYCLGSLEHNDCAAAIDLLAGIFDEYRAEDLEQWCCVAETMPDEKFVQLLKSELRRKLPEVDSAYLTICELLSLDDANIGAVRRRVHEREIESARTEKTLLAGLWEKLKRDTLRIKLKCPLCGDENIYNVKTVIYDPENKQAKPFIGDELTCFSCGEPAEMEVSGEGYFALIAESLRVLGTVEKSGEPDGPIQYISSKLPDGRVLSVGEAIEYYKKRLESDPSDEESLLALGNCFRTVCRFERAEKCYRDCANVNPRCAEAWYTLAFLLKHRGELEEAFDCLKQGLKYRDSWTFYRLRDLTPARFDREYVELYNEIARKLGIIEAPIKPLTLPSNRKVGRNEPCPCGSGKKYKKCCINKKE